MDDKRDPIIKNIEKNFVGNKRIYEINLSRENFNHLSAGCPDTDSLLGYMEDTYFQILPNSPLEMSQSFQPTPDGQGYFAYIGSPIPEIPSRNTTKKQFENLAQKAYQNLEDTINKSGKIPIEEQSPEGKVNLGYVVLGIEKEVKNSKE